MSDTPLGGWWDENDYGDPGSRSIAPDTPSEQHTESNKENTTMDNTPNTISIDGTDYVRADSVIGKDFSSSPVRIVVLQRGWVVVGYYAEDGDKVTVEQAKIIRRWGTTKGLGELATGPVSESVLDPAGMVETHRLGVVLTIACDAGAWKAHL